MRKMKKRIMAWMMVLAMLLSMVPEFGTYASEDVPDTSYDVSETVTTEACTTEELTDAPEEITEDTEVSAEVAGETTEESVEEITGEPAEEPVEEITVEPAGESTEEVTEEVTADIEDEEEVLLLPGDQWKVVGVASPYIYVNGHRYVGSQYSIQSQVTGEILGGWCYDHNKTTAAIGSGLTEAAGTNKLVAISCLVAQGNGAMAPYYYGFNWQGYNSEVVATLANSILAGNSASGSFGSIVDSYVAYIESLDSKFTLIHPYPSFTDNDSDIVYDSTSGLYCSKTMRLNVAEDSNTLSWVSDTVLPEGVYARVSDTPSVPVMINNECYTPGQTITMKSNQYITYLFDPTKISAGKMSSFSQSFTMSQYVIDSKTFTPHGGYQPVIYASYNISALSAQMGDVVRGRLGFQKRSSNTTVTTGCSLYSLAGAEYVLKDAYGNDAKFIVASSDSGDVYGSTANREFVTNKDGYLTYKFYYSGNKSDITDLYSNVTGNNPYTITFDDRNRIICDMGTYRLSETTASPGYKKDDDCRYDTAGKYHEVTLSNSHRNAYIVCREEPHLDPVRLRMVKFDEETRTANPIGAGSLAGAVFEVDYYNGTYTKSTLPGSPTRKWYFQTDENGSWNFTSNAQLLNNDKYDSDERYPGNLIPLGTVTVREITAPEGYIRTWDNSNGYITIDGNEYSDNKLVLYQIRMNDGNTAPQRLLDGNTVTRGDEVITIRAYDPVKRGNIAFDKREYNSDNPMPYIAFVMESMTTHEKHIIVTDENGHATTDFSSFGNRRENVNGNDKYLDDLENPDVIENQLRPTPVWFYGTADEDKWDAAKIQTNRGALPYDTYTITEIASDGNSHTRLIDYGEITFEIKNNREMVNQTVYDMELPVIHTTALSEDTADHIAGAYKTAKVIDTVEYDYLYPERTYRLVGTAMNKKSEKPIVIDGQPLVEEVEFTTGSAERLCHGYQDVVFEFDATLLRGTTMVVYEKLYILDEETNEWSYVTGHEDIEDEGQSVHFTDVHTTATDSNTNSHDSYAVREVTIIDKVFCSNLIKGRTYTVKGMIMVIPDEVGADNELNDYTYTYDESTGTYTDQNGIECHPYLVDGKPVTAEKTFVAEQSGDCIVELAFTFDARPLKNRSINVFEDLYNENGIRIGTHADLTDEEQTIIFHPKDTGILVNTRNKIDGFGGVKTGDVPIMIIVILLLSSVIAAACLFIFRHKELMKGFAKKVMVTVNNHKLHMLLLLVMLTSSGFIIATGVYASNNAMTVNEDVTVGDKVYDYQLITTYESDDPDMHYDFEKKHEGAKLVDTSYEVIDTVYPEKTVTTDKTYKLKDKDESRIADTITQDDIEYTLKDVSWEEVPVSEEVEYTMDFGYCTKEPSYPETYDYTYQSPATGDEVTVSLPFVRLNQGQASWVDGFSVDVTFKNIDGEEFDLAGHKLTYSENLTLKQEDYIELVKLLGYDTSLYRLTNFYWNGSPFKTNEGELWRKGIATGQQYATKYSAYYADTVETGKTYNARATYEATVVDEAAAPTYTIQASALYQKDNIVKNVMLAIVIIVFLVVVIIFMIAGKKKKGEEKL